MNDTILFLLNCTLIGFECVMVTYLSGCFFLRKYSGVIQVVATVILFIFNILYLEFLEDCFPAKIIVGVMLHALWIRTFFRTNFVKPVFFALFIEAFWYIADAAFLAGISALFDIDYNFLLQYPYGYFLICFGIKTIELIGIVILCAFFKRRAQIWTMSWVDWVRILFFPLSSLLISCELVDIYYKAPHLANSLSICACILLCADVMSVFLLDHLENQQLAIRDNAILQQNLKNERESINAWVEAYREERKRSHDFQNQLSVLRGMVDNRVPADQFLGYLDGLLNIELPQTRYINTNRPVADVLLSQKAAVARNWNIEFHMQLDDLSHFPLTDDELVVVFANLIDNAIAACEQITDESQRSIILKIQCNPSVAYLYLENNTAMPVVVKDNRIVTKRYKQNGHGFGIQNVTTILDRCQALYAFMYHPDKCTFSVSIQLFPS